MPPEPPPGPLPIQDQRLKNRNKRRMAYICLFNFTVAFAALTFVPMFSDRMSEWMTANKEIVLGLSQWFYVGNIAVVLSYMGASITSQFLEKR